MMYKPTERKLPKKYDRFQKMQQQEVMKVGHKPVIRSTSNEAKIVNGKQTSLVRKKLSKVEEHLENCVGKMTNSQLQVMLVKQIQGIKSQLQQIKQCMKINNKPFQPSPVNNHQHEEQDESQQQIYAVRTVNNNSRALKPEEHTQLASQNREYPPDPKKLQQFPRNNNYRLLEKTKELIDVRKIQPYLKQFKIMEVKNLMPFYYGYHKKSSKPVIIKYCPLTRSMEHVFEIYELLWKNIVKAKRICINKAFNLNQPLATYILVIQANKYSLDQILSNKVASIPHILCSLIQALQFFHNCGYLYRNFHPTHVMYSFENQVVVVDLKCMRRFLDMKGKHMVVIKDNTEIDDQFVSNNRVRGLKEGRKDDLQSLGYLALYLLQRCLPWSYNNLVQVRSKLTLKQLCGKYPPLLEFMMIVSQMQTEDVPEYPKLCQLLGKI